jgi:tRNA(fMet)-specific endonuclease VapC
LKYLLDTNIISELVSKEPSKKVVEYINNLNQDDVYLSVITIGEIQAGILKT